jgi:hypothetical protein
MDITELWRSLPKEPSLLVVLAVINKFIIFCQPTEIYNNNKIEYTVPHIMKKTRTVELKLYIFC